VISIAAELFELFGSLTLLLTDALFRRIPLPVGWTLIVIVLEDPLDNEGKVQVVVPPGVQLQPEPAAVKPVIPIPFTSTIS